MSVTSFPPTIDELLKEFAEIDDWDERYDYLIDLGKQLPALPELLKTPDNLVKGCMSTVWLSTHVTGADPPQIEIQADSDSLIVRGLIVVVLALFNRLRPVEILKQEEEAVFLKLGLNHHLSPQRRNGLFAMVKRLKQLALNHASQTSE